MRVRVVSVGLGVVSALMLAGVALGQQVVKLGEGETLTISGFINVSLFADRGRFGAFGQGQNAEYANQVQPGVSQGFMDGDFRNTRIRFDFASGPVLGKWSPRATIEADFFGTFTNVPATGGTPPAAPPFADEQPQLRARLIYADLTNGRTTIRIGQDWAPLFAETPVSLTHIAFPLGYGASGKIGWRFPGVFVFTDLSAAGAPLNVQLALAAMKGSGPVLTDPAVGTGEASGLPQLEGKVTLSKRSGKLSWSAYAVGHVDWKDTVPPGTPSATMTGTAVELGGNVAASQLSLHGNVYMGHAIGQQFGHITQNAPANGDIHGWGAWAQAGYDLDPHWSAFVYYGLDQPDQARLQQDHPGVSLAGFRSQSHVGDALVRFRAGRYAVGLEYFRTVTRWAAGPQSADQYALSMLYNF
ncbi:MAG TPA: hypothetical protein VM736_01965 [Gemmatimonadales bacterium]|nr:hypothetical protein [Gemmatimonadales bacterium]